MIQLDPEDVDLLFLYRWHVSTYGYVLAYIQNRKIVILHRLVAQRHYPMLTNDRVVHVTPDKQDNRVQNLCVVSHATVARLSKNKNSASQYRGVDILTIPLKTGNKKLLYRARIKYQGTVMTLGLFEREVDAANTYDLFIVEHNIHSRTNFRGVHLCYNNLNTQEP